MMGTKWIKQCDMCGREEEGGTDLLFDDQREIVTDSSFFRLDCYTKRGPTAVKSFDDPPEERKRLEVTADLCGACGQNLEIHLRKFFPEHFFQKPDSE